VRRGLARIEPACAAPSDQAQGGAMTLPFGVFSPAVEDLAVLAANGFTSVGPWYQPERARQALAVAKQVGLSIVYPVGYPHERYKHGKRIEWDAETTRAELTAQIEALAGEPAITAWYLLPEELVEHDATHLEFLRVATAAIRAADPRGRPILSYQANHRDAGRLAPVVAHLDIATKGAYANFAGHRRTRAWVRWSIDELEAAGDATPWVLPEMFEDPADADATTIAAWVRHDVHAGLVAGATGVLVFSGWRRPNFAAYDDYMAAYRDVAYELNGPLALGDALLAGDRCKGEPATIVTGPIEVTFEAGGETQRLPALAQLDLVHAGAHWTWLVNSSAESMTVRAETWRRADVPLGAEHRIDDDTFLLPPWGVAVLRARG
jgi:hypothetical protein